MDWQIVLTSVVTSLVSSSVITAGIIYILKKSIDRAIDYRFEKSLEESRLNSQERVRRQATIYDKQLEVLREILGLTYRLRNASRDFAEQISKETQLYGKDYMESIKKMLNYQKALIDILIEERALLPPSIFELTHEMKNRTGPMIARIENLRLKNKSETENDSIKARDSLMNDYQKIDETHQSLVNMIQAQIGIFEGKDK